MRYEIDGSPRRMCEGSEETLRVPAVSIAERGADGARTGARARARVPHPKGQKIASAFPKRWPHGQK